VCFHESQKHGINVKEHQGLSLAKGRRQLFAHESHKPLTNILSVTDTIKHRAKDLLGDLFHKKLEEPLIFLTNAAKALQSFSRLPLNLLRREKRRSGVVDVGATADELVG
jgi:hypothetical protein